MPLFINWAFTGSRIEDVLNLDGGKTINKFGGNNLVELPETVPSGSPESECIFRIK